MSSNFQVQWVFGNMSKFIESRQNGRIDSYLYEMREKFQSRILDFSGFGRHHIISSDAEIIRDLQLNHV